MQKPVASLAGEMIRHFRLDGTPVRIQPFGTGHINDTFLVVTDTAHRYVLQRISSVAFSHPDELMNNAVLVTAHLRESIIRRGGDPARETLTFLPATDGAYFVRDEGGCVWRVSLCIDNAISYDLPDSEQIFQEAGRAFGAFQAALMDFPPEKLCETIPHFHDTTRRLNALRTTAAADRVQRAASVQEEIDFAFARAGRTGELVDKLADGHLPLRVTHNDTKLNNVLMDKTTGRGMCVLDLDTVMPGLSAYDFGDAIRFGTNTALEDEADLTRVHFSLPMYRAWCRGYLSQVGSVMSREELASLPVGAWMMTYEVGIRFLTDYLDGDRYFHTAYPEHNLVRARNQFALLKDMEANEAAMADALNCWKEE